MVNLSVSGGGDLRVENSVGSSGSLAELSGAVVGLHGLDVAVLLTLLALFGGVVAQRE